MTLGSLFAGVGGLELGLERALGCRTAWQVERDGYCRHVLARHWPDAERFDDVRTVGAHNLARVDVLCGGFPCVDLSAAGKKAGLGTEDAPTRSGLWYEMRRIIGEIQPNWIVGENIAHRWRAWVPVVRRALWDLGYASVPVRVRACDLGARHERARVFIIATGHADTGRLGWIAAAQGAGGGLDREGWREADRGCAATDATGDGWGEGGPWGLVDAAGRTEHSDGAASDVDGEGPQDGERERGDACPTPGPTAERDPGQVSPGFGLPPRPWMVRGVHGLPGGLDGPWRAAGWTGARLRTARIHALGNACTPQQAEAVGRMIADAIGPDRGPVVDYR